MNKDVEVKYLIKVKEFDKMKLCLVRTFHILYEVIL